MKRTRPPERGWFRPAVGIPLVLAAATALAYAGALRADFTYDDVLYVSDNPHVQAGLTLGGIRWAFTTTAMANWNPLTWMSFQLDRAVFGPWPLGYHLTNVVLHVVNTVLVFFVLRRFTGAVWRSALVAALFALHPLHVESVAWVSERKDVLSACFGLLALYAYAGYAERPGAGRYLGVAAAFALSLLAKPMLVTLPCLLLLLDYWPLERWGWGWRSAKIVERWGPFLAARQASVRRLLLEKVPLFALAVASGVMTLHAQHLAGARNPAGQLPVRLRNAVVAVGAYLRKTAWPADLAPFYPYPHSVSPAHVATACVVVTIVTAVALRAARRQPYLAVGWFWFLGTLAPVSGVLQIMGGHAMADRYTYFPLIGLFLALAWGVADLVRRYSVPRLAAGGLAVGVLVACAAATQRQVEYWENSLSLWEHALRVTAPNPVALNNLGQAYARLGDEARAVSCFREALASDPSHAPARLNLGLALAARQQYDEAIREYRAVVAGDPANAEAHYRLGHALALQGKLGEAVAEYEEALRLDPGHVQALAKRGQARALQGGLAGAVEDFRAALAIDPARDAVAYDLGNALESLGRREEAVASYRRAAALRPGAARYWFDLAHALWPGERDEARRMYRRGLELDPRWPGMASRAAWLLATSGDGRIRNPTAAVRLAEELCESSEYREAEYLDSLGAAYAAAGRYGEAAEAARRALALPAPAVQAEAVRRRLALYEAGKPYREKDRRGGKAAVSQ